MIRKTIIFLFLFPQFLVSAQFIDDFSDGNFSLEPTWMGDIQKFKIEDQMLRLNDNNAGLSYLSTSSSEIENTQWEFWIRLAFTPSDNNHPRIYLTSDNPNLTEPLNGYYLQIGKTGTDNKRLYFYRQTGDEHTLLLTGDHNIASSSNNQIRLKVTRNTEGNWELSADPTGGIAFAPQGVIFDNVHTSTSWFGVYCQYTSSNSNRFFFDDFYVGEIFVDETLPFVEDLFVTSASTIDVVFSEAVNPETAENTENYFVDKNIGAPMIAALSPTDAQKVSLLFYQNFVQEEIYSLTIDKVEDFAGNIMEPELLNFFWYLPGKFDVVFNELMANPNPPVGLPPFEYIELYNTSNYNINLQDWTLQHGTTMRLLPAATIAPNEFLLLVSEAGNDALTDIPNKITVPGLSTSALTNAGTTLILWDTDMELISFVNYNEKWYGNPAKADGGWSLEKLDPLNYCEEANNWIASNDTRGGTPGVINSVAQNNPDQSAPVFVRVGYETQNMVSIFFDEPMDPASLNNTDNYAFDNGLGNPDELILYPPEQKKVGLIFNQGFQPGMVYTATLSDNLTDCAGNRLDINTRRFGIPERADTLDIVINEILFNPPDRGERYIEIYNRSQKVIDLSDYILASKDTIDQVLTSINEISVESSLLFPGEYALLTPNPEQVKKQYMTNNPDGFITSSLPSMSNSSGIIVFSGKGHNVIDLVIYTEDMHYALLNDFKGVALERLNYNRPSNDFSNWHSAAKDVGFGTPGYKNSQFTLNQQSEQESFTTYPKVFSPDNDGIDDVVNISYQLNQPGFTANINVYDSRGRLIRTLYRSELLATEGILSWDGTTDEYQKADIGVYIIYVELFNPGGTVKNHKLTTIVGGKL
jgi:hypothetical protein